jgi:hypothetical protein
MLPLILATLAAFLGLPIGGALLAALQHAHYRRRVRAGTMAESEVPFFGALLLRSMMWLLILVVIGAVVANVVSGPAGQAPSAPPAPAR